MDQNSLKILVVSDQCEDITRVNECLESGSTEGQMILSSLSSFEAAVVQMERDSYDACIVDYRLAKNAGMMSLLSLRQKGIVTPLIFLVDEGSERAVKEAQADGSTDFLLKSQLSPELLTQAVRYGVALRKEQELRKSAEIRFRQASVQNQQLLLSITSILIGIRPDGVVTHWNSIAVKILGVKAGDTINRRLEDCQVSWDFGRIQDAIIRCHQQEKPVRLDDLEFVRPGGKHGFLGFTINPIWSDSGELSGFLLLGADITARKENEEQLRIKTDELRKANARIEQEKVRYEALLASIGDGMIAVDRDGKIIMMNIRAQDMLGLTDTSCVGKPFQDVFSIEDEKGNLFSIEQRPLSICLATGKRVTAVAYYRTGGNSKFPAAITASPIILEGQIIGVIEIFRDITKEKEVDLMKSEFISTVSHELRTPLTGVRESVAQVLEKILGPINSEQAEFLSIALKELDRLATIINDLLDVAKIEAGKMELRKAWFDINVLIRDFIFEYQRVMENKNLMLKSHSSAQSLRVFADAEKVKQIITNLVSNAYKFTDPGGMVIIEAAEAKGEVQISVTDTGYGIPKEDLERIFERFVQVGRTYGPGIKGTGLGLAICKSLVELHQGRIWVESEAGKGARFTFTLPCVQDQGSKVYPEGINPMEQAA
ncbi:MAG: ATP-binding protein [Candidatus Omnitrophica bacterium]|nr:ATP-binding protein [Candidatus Omnitrophota bacterium]